jgi:hypothetical protein
VETSAWNKQTKILYGNVGWGAMNDRYRVPSTNIGKTRTFTSEKKKGRRQNKMNAPTNAENVW